MNMAEALQAALKYSGRSTTYVTKALGKSNAGFFYNILKTKTADTQNYAAIAGVCGFDLCAVKDRTITVGPAEGLMPEICAEMIGSSGQTPGDISRRIGRVNPINLSAHRTMKLDTFIRIANACGYVVLLRPKTGGVPFVIDPNEEG